MTYRTVNPSIIYQCDACGQEYKQPSEQHCYNSAPPQWVRLVYYLGVDAPGFNAPANEHEKLFCMTCFLRINTTIADFIHNSDKFKAEYDKAGEEIEE